MQRDHPINPFHFDQNHRFPSQNVPNNLPRPSILPHFQPSNLPYNLPPTQHPYSSDDERRLRDEVIYLHSLWHRGPPGRPLSFNHLSQTPHFLKPSTQTPFKKSKVKPKTVNPHPVSDKEWPVESKPKCPSPPGSSWPAFKLNSAPVSRPATAEEKERVLALKIQLKVLDSCAGLFHKEGVSGDEDEDSEEEDDGDDVEEYEFFMKLFEDNDELRNYYEKNCENGEFYCLVCGALANKFGRKYKNCVALVQHSVTISRTKKRMAHRGYGHVICKVLGWDVNRLPSLPSTVEDGTGQSGNSGGKVNNNADSQKDSSVVEREGNSANTNDCESGSRDKPDTIKLVNDGTEGPGCTASELLTADPACTASELAQSVPESNAHVDGCEVNDHGDLEKDLLEQKDTLDSAQEVANNVVESVDTLDSGLLLTGNDAK